MILKLKVAIHFRVQHSQEWKDICPSVMFCKYWWLCDKLKFMFIITKCRYYQVFFADMVSTWCTWQFRREISGSHFDWLLSIYFDPCVAGSRKFSFKICLWIFAPIHWTCYMYTPYILDCTQVNRILVSGDWQPCSHKAMITLWKVWDNLACVQVSVSLG